MIGVQSNTGVAKSIATSIASSLDGLSGGGVITEDTQTTISGNNTAGEAIQSMRSASDTILQAVGQATLNLQSVASEFEAADKMSRELFSGPISTANGGTK